MAGAYAESARSISALISASRMPTTIRAKSLSPFNAINVEHRETASARPASSSRCGVWRWDEAFLFNIPNALK